MMKKCSICQKLYMSASDNFHKDKNMQDGYKTKCKQCIKDNRTEPIKIWPVYNPNVEIKSDEPKA